MLFAQSTRKVNRAWPSDADWRHDGSAWIDGDQNEDIRVLQGGAFDDNFASQVYKRYRYFRIETNAGLGFSLQDSDRR